MKSEKLSRLDPANIKDILIRARFYKELRQGQSDWDEWEVSLDEVAMPELISLRYYGTAQLKKIVAECAGLDDLRGELRSGSVIKLPPVKWVRTRIRYYCEFEMQ